MNKKNIYILLGGEWHDFEGFAAAMTQLLDKPEYNTFTTYDADVLTKLDQLECDLLLSYTCLAQASSQAKPGVLTKFTHPQVQGLLKWVQKGGAFLAAHAATVTGETDIAYENLIGGAFISHPPQCTFQVVPLSEQHTITMGINTFTVDDELYIERYASSVHIHMVAIYEGVAYPVVYSREEGRGKVVHIALGHSQKTWDLEPFKRLMLQTVRWMIYN
jgi:type 1 glutamine amidotransferase